MHKENMKTHQKAERRKERIRKLRKDGMTWPEIGRLYGITPQRAQQLGREKDE